MGMDGNHFLVEGYRADNHGRVKKANSVVMHRAQGILQAEDHKLFNYLLNRAWSRIREPLHRIPVQDAIDYLGPSANVQMLNESLSRLGEVFIEITYEENTGEKRVSMMHFLSFDSSRAQSGILYFAFDQMLLPLLAEPPIYALLSLKDIRKFKTLAGERLYETMMMRKHTSFNHHWQIPIAELVHIFGQPADIRFDNFKNRFIVPAVDEVNKYAPFNVIVDYTRESGRGRKVTWVTFTVVPKTHEDMMAPLRLGVSKRRPRDNRSIDLFDGQTDEERGEELFIGEQTLAEAAERMVGLPLNLEDLQTEWRESVAGRKVADPDHQFAKFVLQKIKKLQDPVVAALSDDILGDLLK